MGRRGGRGRGGELRELSEDGAFPFLCMDSRKVAISSCLIIEKPGQTEKPNDSAARTSTSDSMSNANGSAPKLARTASFGVRSPTVGYSGPWSLQNA